MKDLERGGYISVSPGLLSIVKALPSRW